MTDKNEYSELIRKYRNGSCTADELKRIRELIYTPEFMAVLEQQWEGGIEQSFKPTKADRQRQFQRILSSISSAKKTHTATTKTRTSLWGATGTRIAACIAFCAFAAFLYFLLQPKADPGDPVELSDNSSLVLPGKQTAQILFDDGTALDLEKIVGDTTIVRPEFSINKTRDGKITYHFNRGQNKNRLVYNTIVTPKGGEYKLILPDGTAVWLNAMTKLRYPVAFQSDTREVHLEGEAYFEVTKVTNQGKRVPFIVKTGEQSLEVLGTAFNISNYKHQVVTTLTEGKVKLTYSGNKVGEKFLVPNEQAKYDVRKAEFTKELVDPFYFMAWKNGNFAFDNASIYEVMDAISRWYDVDIHYHGDLEKVRFSGSISRYENIDKLLKTIALAGGVRFDRKERRVDVM